MTGLIEVQTSELTGEPLAWSVAEAEGLTAFIADPQYGNPYRVMVHFRREGKLLPQQERFKPQVEWSQGGPLIERHQINLEWDGSDGVAFWWQATHQDIVAFQVGDTPLVAACRAIVAAKLGDTVQVPKELIQ